PEGGLNRSCRAARRRPGLTGRLFAAGALRKKRSCKGGSHLSTEAILRKLEPIFRSVIDPDLVLSEELDASAVPLWDSLNHIILAVEIERHLGVALTTDELARLRNVGDMVSLLKQKGVRA